MDSKSSHLVFVYGTLKKGEPNHHVLYNGKHGFAQFVSKGLTVNPYPLIIYSRYNIPFLLDKPGMGKRVYGEIYAVDDSVLADLDDLEDHPDFYQRKQIDIELISNNGESNEPIKIWTYLFPKFKSSMLEVKCFDNYSSYGDHGLEYVISEEVRSLDELED
ncbi:gamma-glutamylaminecyclotransferase C-like [Panonychus citri]|uniref:gamma-glutamylaminecyclotransferase C-like n=1 Tax=Panonychus citri TaxID=50023 RepID=UPI002307681D|nr:gamma-glutamylaminecyclotransferase C-like [Panonychus citri]